MIQTVIFWGQFPLPMQVKQMQTQIEQDCLQINTRVIKLVKIRKIKLKLEKERKRELFLKIALHTT